MDEYEDLIDFYRDSIELYHGNVDAFYTIKVKDIDELAQRLEQYLDHLIYMLYVSFRAQHDDGLLESVHRKREDQVVCVVNDTFTPGRYCVILYHQSKPAFDYRFSSLKRAYKEVINLGFTQPKLGALEEHLETYV
ncbi:hypothetical protein [Vibrio cyclitrophicus]|uniref:hypothetical protein n=1 Tax=Vibrio cyclitrophicus TaxID=47951 RepID=UPI0032E45F47